MDKAIYLPTLLAITLHAQNGPEPSVRRAHGFCEYEGLLNAVCVFWRPEHLQRPLLFCRRPCGEWVRVDGYLLHWRQLPEVSRENQVDASERPLLLASVRVRMSQARSP